MSKIEHIFIDMDGVLADFISSAFAAHGRDYDPAEYPPHYWGVLDVLGVDERGFWRKITAAGSDLWRNSAPYPWMRDLIATASGIAPVSVLSAPSNHPSCHYGKRQWMDKHLPGIELILCRSKHWLAAPGRVLIDDNDDNVTKWQEQGGRGLAFPQPWNMNREHCESAFEYTVERLLELEVVPCS